MAGISLPFYHHGRLLLKIFHSYVAVNTEDRKQIGSCQRSIIVASKKQGKNE